MGANITISCKACGSKWQCQTGSGIMHGDLKHVTALYPKDIQKEIQNCSGESPFPWFEFNYKISYCRKCNTIESIPCLKMGDAHTEFVGKCSKCGQEALLIKNIEELECPSCHKKTLLEETTGIWD